MFIAAFLTDINRDMQLEQTGAGGHKACHIPAMWRTSGALFPQGPSGAKIHKAIDR